MLALQTDNLDDIGRTLGLPRAQHPPGTRPPLDLTQLRLREPAVVVGLAPVDGPDPIGHRLDALGFVRGEPVRVVAFGPFGGDPLLVQVGSTRFALRRPEAQRVRVLPEPPTGDQPR